MKIITKSISDREFYFSPNLQCSNCHCC